MKKFSTLGIAVFAVAAIVMSGCDSDKKTSSSSSKEKVSMGAINDKCPVSNMPVDKSVKCAHFEGHDVGFCCGNCQAKWDSWSKADKEAKWTKCMTAAK